MENIFSQAIIIGNFFLDATALSLKIKRGKKSLGKGERERKPKTKMKICDITQFYSPCSGGVKRYLSEKQDYVRRLAKDEHFLIVPGEKNQHLSDKSVHTITIKSPRLDKTSRYRVMLNLKTLSLLIDEINPDIIEVGDPYQLAWFILRKARRLKIPVVGFYHSHFPEAYLRTFSRYGGKLAETAFRNMAKGYIISLFSKFRLTVVPSYKLCGLLKNWGLDNAVPLPLGVDTENFSPGPKDESWRKFLAIPPDAFLLLYVGRLSKEKNLVLLLETFRCLLEEEPGNNYWLLIIGDGPLRSLVLDLKKKLGRIAWIPYLDSKEDLARSYRSADLFVHPGIVETFGLVTIESQSCGCPVIGVHGTNMDEQIEGGLEYWPRKNCPRAFAEAIRNFRQTDLRELGLELSRKVRAKYGWGQVFERLWGYYLKAMGKEGRDECKEAVLEYAQKRGVDGP
ncbi:glycosyltransferase [Candidatus Methylacidiphilum infernorum]|uniref:Glycosyltransferase n=1 Tax=Methylacidiphilum infernorum (isolate V4) TaxID=481448 RepID=B3DYJ3_METI4|nr:glycosyltransferase [Candidatus Methylacidiphilum infernorum]ACD84041.1 Glycosyltransferase [Methylacidiphilum infernorum V4]